MKKQIRFLFTATLILMFIATILLTGCSSDTPSSTVTPSNATDIGTGATVFTFEVRLSDGTSTFFNVHTDENTIGKALLDAELIDGDESDYGLYVTTVNGTTLSWDETEEYWAFYIDGEHAFSGVDTTEIEPGKTYTLAVEKG